MSFPKGPETRRGAWHERSEWRAREGEPGSFVQWTNAAWRTPGRAGNPKNGRDIHGVNGAPERITRRYAARPSRGPLGRNATCALSRPAAPGSARTWEPRIRTFEPSRHKKPPRGWPFVSGAPERIRTSDLWLRRPTLYPAELRAREARLYRNWRLWGICE